MNLKRIFGALLTALGIGGLIYTAIIFVNSANSNYAIKTLVVFGILGIVFFTAGISLIRTTKDEA
jgi:succinyl-CoA synthetase alpha subunit